MLNKEFIIERTNTDKHGVNYFTTIARFDTFDEALKHLESIKSKKRHEIWCEAWVHSAAGYAPMAWIN